MFYYNIINVIRISPLQLRERWVASDFIDLYVYNPFLFFNLLLIYL